MVKQFRIGSVFAESLKVLFANFIPFFVITALVNIPTFVYGVAWFKGLERTPPDDLESAIQRGWMILGVIGLFLGPLATGAVTYGALQYLRGKSVSIAESISVGFSKMLLVLGVAIVTGLAIMGGLILLIVPGLIALCVLFVAVPAAVVESGGVSAALGRSAFLTKGYRWPIFGIALLVGITQNVLTRVVEVGLESGLKLLIGTLLVGVVTSAWQACAAAVSYYQLRSVKESVELEEIASVFD